MWLGIYLSTDEIVGQVVDDNLKTVSLRRRPIITYTPKSGHVEQDPEEWWTTFVSVVKWIKHDIKDQKIQAVCVASQREGLVFVDSEEKPMGRCIIWMDTRAYKEAECLKRRIGKNTLYKLTGLPVDATFSLPRLLWIKQHGPQILRKAKYCLQPKDYLVYKLTGKFLTDYTLVCRTLLYDIRKLEWIEEFFKEFRIPNLFPQVVNPTDVVGYLEESVANELNLEKGIPVVAGGGDRPIQVVAAGAKKTGEFVEHMGSVVNLSTILDEPKIFEDAKIVVGFHAIGKKWLSEASVSAGKLILNWLIELLGIGREELNLIDHNVSQTSPSTEDLLIVPHLQGARAPWWSAHSRGTIYGLTLKHTKWCLLRAFMESVAYELKLVLDIFNKNGIAPSKIICLEKMEDLKAWHIIKSSCINFPYTFINLEEPISYGAALISMLGTGRDDLFRCWIKNRVENNIAPQKELTKTYEKIFTKYAKAVKNTLKYYK